MLRPVTLAVEPGKGGGKRRIFPAPGKPGRVVQHAKGTQGLDQVQHAGVGEREAAPIAGERAEQIDAAFFYGLF